MSNKRWKEILNWEIWPCFGHIHDFPPKEFNKLYYIPPNLEEVINNIYFSLLTGQSHSDKLFIGMPGCGKTTFLYWLMKINHPSYSGELMKKYHFEIIHVNRLVTPTMEETRKATAEFCWRIYENYFLESGPKDDFIVIQNNERLQVSEKINRLLDIIINKKEKFSKKLIIVIDDIDEVEGKTVEEILRFLYSYMEPVTIQKWLTVRETTLPNYDESFLRFIRTKFPDKFPFPRVDLHRIIEKRIKTINPKGKNPFSPGLCSQIIAAHNNDIRDAMGIFIKFFEINKPKETKDSASDEWLENFFKIAFTKTLTFQKVFPNIYLRPRSSRFPLERDIFLLLQVKHTIDGQFSSILEKYYTSTITVLKKKQELFGDDVRVSPADISGVIKYLKNNQLIDANDADCYYATPKGGVFTRLLTGELYNTTCKLEVQDEGSTHSAIFWDMVDINPDFSSMIW